MSHKRFPFGLRLVPGSVGEEEEWGAWLRGTYAMVWYMIGVMAVFLFAMIEFYHPDNGIWMPALMGALILVLGGFGFWKIWGNENGPVE